MRDGVRLAANLYLPSADGRYPVLLVRTPYGKEGEQDNAIFFAERGYAVVAQDARGRYNSDGDWYPFRHEAEDGHDAIEWAARQPWSNGKVVTMGASYLGMVQWLAATQGSRALAGMIIRVAPADLYLDLVHPGGASGNMLPWALTMGRRTFMRKELTLVSWPTLLQHVPVADAPRLAGFEPAFFRDWIEHAARDEYWRAMSWRDSYDRIRVPVFVSGGWYDTFQSGTIRNFAGLMTSGSSGLRRTHRLVMGPWIHGDVGASRPAREPEFGPVSAFELRETELRWLDHYIRGLENGAEADSQIQAFAMGSNEWRSSDVWPPARVEPTRYHLHSGGNANTLGGDGRLMRGEPGNQPANRYEYDPGNPVPTNGLGHCCSESPPAGPIDQRAVERRNDVLVYSSEPLLESVEIAGPVVVHLFASSSAPDTDWTAKLVDVAPDGFARNLTHGILRARFRRSFEQPELLTPGEIYEFVIDAGQTWNVFLAGHRIRLEISSSNFPRYTRNTNTGRIPEKDTTWRIARQTVFHDRERPSHLLLPVKDGTRR
jgi:putative CocE/NonD family hydrolase